MERQGQFEDTYFLGEEQHRRTHQQTLLVGSQEAPKAAVAGQLGRGEVSPRSAPTAEAVALGSAAWVLEMVMAPVTTSGTAVGRVLLASVMVALAASDESRSRRPLQRCSQSQLRALVSRFPRLFRPLSAAFALRSIQRLTMHAACEDGPC